MRERNTLRPSRDQRGFEPLPRFTIYLIKPTRYDDEGYPLQWRRSMVPSNALACLVGIVRDALDRGVFKPEIDVELVAMDEIHSIVEPEAIADHIAARGGKGFIGFVGVQSNQFPRAVDLARRFRARGLPVCIGGFHVSGCLAMLKTMPPDMVEAQALGVSFFAGEAEDNRIDDVLRDAYAGALEPIYNHLARTPNLAGAPIPQLPLTELDKMYSSHACFDLGRGCPFECSFCTIINVQGRKSRFRTPDDLEKIIRANAAIGIDRFFLTDDNFARNAQWEAFCDRLIALRDQGFPVRLAIQVDTLAHKIRNFIAKCVAAGADQIFIGLENINSDSLEAVKKRQNRIEDYRAMFLAWKAYPVVITCGYILGFPNDTKESILRDVETIKRELPIDTVYLNYLTPLPGSEDHKRMVEAGEWIEPDLNKYDLSHRVTHHPRMSDAEWEEAYVAAHRSFYTFEHMERVLRRMIAFGSNKKLTTLHRLLVYREAVRLEGVAMLESGFGRIRRRRERRSGLPLENPLIFYPRNLLRTAVVWSRAAVTYARMRLMLRRLLRDPKRMDYRDSAMMAEGETVSLAAETRTTDYALRRGERVKASTAQG
jgi:pyruvate-formate lyase-activating enzyme